MTRTRGISFRALMVSAALAWTGGTVTAFATTNTNAYLSGTYQLVHYDATPQDDQLTLTFDGAGNFTGTDIQNQGGSINTASSAGTYTVASDGTFTAESGVNTLAGTISTDGNVIVMTRIVSGGTPSILVGVKQGLIANSNVASGLLALAANTTGAGNSAVGDLALGANTSGANNTAFGYQALYQNTTGKGNAAQGVNALYNNTTGIRNLGIGSNALFDNVSGSYNIALGFDAGYNVTTGSNNIEIGASGTASDNGTIRIGVQGTQTSTTIAGIYGAQVTGSAVYVTSAGQLGVLASSERYKTDIAPMGSDTQKLGQLRPVSFRLKTDPQGAIQYGLIAEEVAKVYPELVIRDDAGKIQGVHYEELAPMLLNEVQQQRQALDSEAEQRRMMQQELTELRQLHQSMQAAIAQLQATNSGARAH